jgi:hypothetical protein
VLKHYILCVFSINYSQVLFYWGNIPLQQWRDEQAKTQNNSNSETNALSTANNTNVDDTGVDAVQITIEESNNTVHIINGTGIVNHCM